MTFKLIPMLLILAFLYTNREKSAASYTTPLLIGLFFCMLGDAFIIFSFIAGLAAFLLGHLFYVFAFWKRRRLPQHRYWYLMFLLLYGLFFAFRFTGTLVGQDQAGLAVAVTLYIAVISMMGWFAFLTADRFALFGSLLFILSDTILAWNRFMEPVPYAGEWIMLTYYSAQLLIASSATRSLHGLTKSD
ncbi:MAG: lysoplasmalogenase [Bacillus sp. (in: firmicutes)]